MDWLIGYLIPFLVVLTVLVFVHELGHYLVARYNGVRIEVFSIGFGPEIFGWTDRVQTRWKFSLIPLGGYVRMFGDADASSRPDHDALRKAPDELRQQSLHSKTPWQRIAISAAGPLANFLFSFIVLAIVFMIKGQPTYSTTVAAVSPGMQAEKAGLLADDTILKINHETVHDFEQVRGIIRKSGGKELNFEIQRQQAMVTITMTPEVENGAVKLLGINPAIKEFVPQGPLSACKDSVVLVYHLCTSLTYGVGRMIVGKGSANELGSFLSIGSMAGDSAKFGAVALISFMAILSVNLGMINLFPIPMLDGGHILFYLIEIVRKKPISEKAQEYAFIMGFVLVMGLMLFSTWNDLVRFKVIGWFLKGNN
ncbi:MAG: RIP metalloprotease RseP [Alphaproteobacteria bacterium]